MTRELDLDVSAALPFDKPSFVASAVHLPPPEGTPARAVLICWPGGSYARAYWDMQIPGHPGYSFADHMTARGFVVVAAGVGMVQPRSAARTSSGPTRQR